MTITPQYNFIVNVISCANARGHQSPNSSLFQNSLNSFENYYPILFHCNCNCNLAPSRAAVHCPTHFLFLIPLTITRHLFFWIVTVLETLRRRAQPSTPQFNLIRQLFKFLLNYYQIHFIVIVFVTVRHCAQPSQPQRHLVPKLFAFLWKLIPNLILLQL